MLLSHPVSLRGEVEGWVVLLTHPVSLRGAIEEWVVLPSYPVSLRGAVEWWVVLLRHPVSLRGTVEGWVVLPSHPVSLKGAVYAEHVSRSSLLGKLINELAPSSEGKLFFLLAHVNTESLLNANVGDVLLFCQV